MGQDRSFGGFNQKESGLAKRAPDPARSGALRLLDGVREGAPLSDQANVLAALAPPDQARAARLAAGVLRHRERADAVIATHVRRKPSAPVADILRLGVVEMLELGAPAHAVVDEAVGLARAQGRKGEAASGMVNAVLRKAAAFSGWSDLPPQAMPGWLRGPVAATWGEDAARAIEAAHQRGAPLDLTPRTDWLMEGADRLPTGSLRVQGPAQVSALPGFDAGEWWVQDAAAALPARLLDPRPGERIADLCAAPGGKTLQLAAAGARVTAVDLNPARLRRVAENLTRCRLEAELIAADALDWRPEGDPDAILLDAPCSATGTIRRHPDLPFIRDGSGVPALLDGQRRLIDHALSLLPPGGRMVYAVCSLLPDEGEAQVAAALARHPGLTVEPFALPGMEADWITPGGGLRTRPDHWPGRGGMDGFFMARLRKPG